MKVEKEAKQEFVCATCGIISVAYNCKNRKFCSPACYNKSRAEIVRNNPNFLFSFKGKKHTEQFKKMVSEKNKILWQDKNFRMRVSKKISARLREVIGAGKRRTAKYWLGKKMPREIVERRALSQSGKNHWNWKGEMYQRDYPLVFKKMRKEILGRDNFSCAICGGEQQLLVHHIDYDKNNNLVENLITLCRCCHGKLIKNPQDMQLELQNCIAQWYEQDSYLQEMSLSDTGELMGWLAE